VRLMGTYAPEHGSVRPLTMLTVLTRLLICATGVRPSVRVRRTFTLRHAATRMHAVQDRLRAMIQASKLEFRTVCYSRSSIATFDSSRRARSRRATMHATTLLAAYHRRHARLARASQTPQRGLDSIGPYYAGLWRAA
jgi:hypothetical protein